VSGPNVVCAGCGEPTSLNKPVCDRCLKGIAPGASFCELCNAGLETDKHGYYHLTKTGGYAGKCAAMTADSATGDQSGR
jgi:predicted amidophosphoribosyltransferase